MPGMTKRNHVGHALRQFGAAPTFTLAPLVDDASDSGNIGAIFAKLAKFILFIQLLVLGKKEAEVVDCDVTEEGSDETVVLAT